MTIIWLSVKEGVPARGYWDQRLLESFFKGETHIESDHIEPREEAIVIIPGAYQGEYIDEINHQLSHLEKCTVVVTSDEENNFPLDDLDHRDMRLFANYYNPKYKAEINWLPIGPANIYDIPLQDKTHNFVFLGQVTSPQREGYVKELRSRTDGIVGETQGFAQGLSPDEYYQLLASAKVAPSPAGAVSPDAFRTYEAITAGAVPIPVDTQWHEQVFGPVPFPVVDDFEQVNGYLDEAINRYPELNNKVQMWWLMTKRNIKNSILPPKDKFTVILPVSPIKSHPSIDIMDETIKTIRSHTDAEIIVTFDGVREEQEDRRDAYEEAKRRFLWECFHNPLYENVIALDFAEHSHQVKMAREALKFVETDAILYVEQDTPLTPDLEIDWEKCLNFIKSGEANVVRFHFESHVPKEHEHLMIGKPEGGFLRTAQWSQRPHLASKAYYQRILDTYFTQDAICFIEDKMHGIVHEDWKIHGWNGWFQHRVWIYHPDGNIKRSYHTDGRAGEAKWDEKQVW